MVKVKSLQCSCCVVWMFRNEIWLVLLSLFVFTVHLRSACEPHSGKLNKLKELQEFIVFLQPRN